MRRPTACHASLRPPSATATARSRDASRIAGSEYPPHRRDALQAQGGASSACFPIHELKPASLQGTKAMRSREWTVRLLTSALIYYTNEMLELFDSLRGPSGDVQASHRQSRHSPDQRPRSAGVGDDLADSVERDQQHLSSQPFAPQLRCTRQGPDAPTAKYPRGTRVVQVKAVSTETRWTAWSILLLPHGPALSGRSACGIHPGYAGLPARSNKLRSTVLTRSAPDCRGAREIELSRSSRPSNRANT